MPAMQRLWFVQLFIGVINFNLITNLETKPSLNWRSIEDLAETTPYVIALLNNNREYICTGCVIDKSTAITSGSCVNLKPAYLVVGAGVFSSRSNKNNIIRVSHTVLHGEYDFEFRDTEQSITKMHNNIGLVFVTRPILEVFIVAASVAELYAAELKNKEVSVVGYGPAYDNSNILILQEQNYHQSPCSNPKWYYCICGTELPNKERDLQHFGKGAPVLYEEIVIGISAAPCSQLTLRKTGVKYNIFTLLGPYMTWIQKKQNQTINQRAMSTVNAGRTLINVKCTPIFVTLFFSKHFL